MIGAQQNEDDLGGEGIPLFVRPVGGEHDGLHALNEVDAEEGGHVFAFFFTRGRHLRHRLSRGRAFGDEGGRFREFDVRGVVAFGAVGDDVFTDVGNHLEFVGTGAADRTRVGAYRTEDEPHSGEDALIGFEHDFVALAGVFRALIERIRVLHHEFAGTHHAEAGTAFVAELRTDLEEVHGHLTPARDFAAADGGDHFFARGLNHEVAVVTILKAQKFRAVLIPAAGFHPQFRGLHDGHRQFDRARAHHLFADDGFDFVQNPHPHRHHGVDAGGNLLNESGTDGIFLTGNVGVGRRFLEGRDEKTARTHG